MSEPEALARFYRLCIAITELEDERRRLIIGSPPAMAMRFIAWLAQEWQEVTLQTPDIRSGVLKVWDSGTYKATVQFDASTQQFVPNINVSRDIASGDMTIGRKVAVAFFDQSNPADAVLFAVWT